MSASPTFSVVIATRDRTALLLDALRSAAAQDPPPLEIRIAEDCVPSRLARVATSGPPPVRVIPAASGLAARARNLGCAGAAGDVLAFLDDDDRWLPGHLAGLSQAFRDPAVAFAWRDCAVIREEIGSDGERRETERREIAHDWDTDLMSHDDYLPPSSWGVRRSLFDRLGGFDESFRFSEDWDFVLRAAATTTVRRVPGVTVEVRMRPEGNLSAESGPERRACLDQLAARHGLPPLVPKTFWEVALAVAAAEERAARPPRATS